MLLCSENKKTVEKDDDILLIMKYIKCGYVQSK